MSLSFVSSGSMNVALASGIVGASMLQSSVASPISSVSLADAPKKKIASIEEMSNKPINHKIHNMDRRSHPGGHGATAPPTPLTDTGGGIGFITPTQSQIACAERLGLNLAACNEHGVYIHRNQAIRAYILSVVSATSMDDVTQDMLDGIRGLHLAGAGITSLRARDLDGLNLRFLYLQNNELSELPEGLLDNQTELETFYVHNNDLTEIPQGFFDNNPLLKTIYLHKNDLQLLPEDTFSSLNALTHLRLHKNQLSNLPTDFLSESTGLERLTLYGNPLQISEDVFRNLQSQNPNSRGNFKVIYDSSSTNTNILIEINNGNTIPLAEVLHDRFSPNTNHLIELNNAETIPLTAVISFFEHATERKHLVFYPSTLSEPRLTSALSDSQRAFLCRYLDRPSPSLGCLVLT